MKNIKIYKLIASTDETSEFLGLFKEHPTSSDYSSSEYKGYSIIVSSVSHNFSKDEILDITGYSKNDIDEDFTFEEIMDEFNDLSLIQIANYLERLSIYFENDELLELIEKENKKSDDLLWVVENKLAMHFNLTHWKKYQHIDGVSVRIANHIHNPNNGKCDVNVVISDVDKTSKRYHNAKEDLEYSSNDDVDTIVKEIISEIETKLKDLEEESFT